jgi:hypothetical protein
MAKSDNAGADSVEPTTSMLFPLSSEGCDTEGAHARGPSGASRRIVSVPFAHAEEGEEHTIPSRRIQCDEPDVPVAAHSPWRSPKRPVLKDADSSQIGHGPRGDREVKGRPLEPLHEATDDLHFFETE